MPITDNYELDKIETNLKLNLSLLDAIQKLCVFTYSSNDEQKKKTAVFYIEKILQNNAEIGNNLVELLKKLEGGAP